jgi:hypothetical protein
MFRPGPIVISDDEDTGDDLTRGQNKRPRLDPGTPTTPALNKKKSET